jgi:hypothetical protein
LESKVCWEVEGGEAKEQTRNQRSGSISPGVQEKVAVAGQVEEGLRDEWEWILVMMALHLSQNSCLWASLELRQRWREGFWRKHLNRAS